MGHMQFANKGFTHNVSIMSKDSIMSNFSALDINRKSPQIAKTTNYTPSLKSPKEATKSGQQKRARILESHYMGSKQYNVPYNSTSV